MCGNKLFVKTKILLEKSSFQRDFEFFKNISFTKMYKEHQKLNLAKKIDAYLKTLCYTRVSLGSLVLGLNSYS